ATLLPIPWAAPVTMAILSRSLMTLPAGSASNLVCQPLPADPGQPGAGDGVAPEVRHVELVAALAPPRQVGRPADEDRVVVPGQERLLPGGRDAPDLVRGVTGDVQVARLVERQAVGESSDPLGVDLARPEVAVAVEVEPEHPVGVALGHEQGAAVARDR